VELSNSPDIVASAAAGNAAGPRPVRPHSWRGEAMGAHPLLAFSVRRVCQLVPLILIVIVLNWTLIHIAPGSAQTYFTPLGGGSRREIANLRSYLGVDHPWYVQLLTYGKGILTFNFGNSIEYSTPVLRLILDALPATLLVAGTGFVLSSVVGVLLGLAAARSSRPRVGKMLNLVTLGTYSMPAFWLADLLILLFAFKLGWLPAQGESSLQHSWTGIDHAMDVARHMVLPVIAYAAFPFGNVFRLMYGRAQEVMNLDFIRATHVRGVPERRIVYRHVLPNAILPVLTVIGSNLGFIFAGSVLVETVFAWPGVGLLLSSAISARDYPVILGIFTVTAIAISVANALTDILYAVIDPRILL
jgi:ABC-type dipeptide/oligopeptide/nickel transport system permease component